MKRKFSRFRLVLMPVGIVLWALGWCLTSVGLVDEHRKAHANLSGLHRN